MISSREQPAPILSVELDVVTAKAARHAATPESVGPLPLVLGVTGHRDLRPPDIAVLEERVAAIFTDYRQRYPHTPLVLLSPLAEGADRLVARVALRCGAKLIVPLPMPLDAYAQDFADARSLEELQEFLAEAEEVFTLPLARDLSEKDLLDSGEARSRQYAHLGAYIARHSQVLIALWDGQPSDKAGGTAQVVEFFLNGIPEHHLEHLRAPAHGHLHPVESGPVIHVITPRLSAGEVDGEPLTAHTRFARREDDSRAEAAYNQIYAHMEAFNADALALGVHGYFRASVQRAAGYLLPDDKAATLPAWLHGVRARHAVADTLAQHFQRKTLRTLVLLLGIVFVATGFLEVFHLTDIAGFLFASPLLLVGAYGLWFGTVHKRRWQDKYQDYRALAEGLRVEFFWLLGGLHDTAADHYLRKQHGELDWIRNAVRNAALERGVGQIELEEDDRTVRLQMVLDHWVRDQSKYFGKAGHREHEESEKYEHGVEWLLLGGQAMIFLIGGALLIRNYLGAVGAWLDAGNHAGALVTAAIMMAVMAASMHTYAEKKALAQHAKQYKRIRSIFSHAERRLCKDIEDGVLLRAERVILDLGKEALAENGDWVMTHRERPVDVPHGA